jgi:hypothetical protein
MNFLSFFSQFEAKNVGLVVLNRGFLTKKCEKIAKIIHCWEIVNRLLDKEKMQE